MNKFLKLINEQIPTQGGIPTGQGINPNQPNNLQKPVSTASKVGGVMQKVGANYKGALERSRQFRDFTRTGDFSVLEGLGQYILKRDADSDTYKINFFGKKGYDKVIIIDKQLISKITLRTDKVYKQLYSNESFEIIKQSGLFNNENFIRTINEQQGELGINDRKKIPWPKKNNEKQMELDINDPRIHHQHIKEKPVPPKAPEFLFSITGNRDLGASGIQYTLSPIEEKLTSFLNKHDIKFVTFLREPSDSNDTITDIKFAKNVGKLQFFDKNNQFIQLLETDVRFEYSLEEKVYKIGSSITSHTFADIEETELLLRKGIVIINPKDNLFQIVSGNVIQGKPAIFRNTATHQQFTGIVNNTTSPDRNISFTVMTHVKPYTPQNTQQSQTQQKPPVQQKVQ